ncbi:hypothetical protein TRVL_01189 [Trypanosoma vivax]|nr:hypothetical protein TRVL_01189 [Trypanosoma vivax]
MLASVCAVLVSVPCFSIFVLCFCGVWRLVLSDSKTCCCRRKAPDSVFPSLVIVATHVVVRRVGNALSLSSTYDKYPLLFTTDRQPSELMLSAIQARRSACATPGPTRLGRARGGRLPEGECAAPLALRGE